jgi:hypothetical protein
MPVRNLPRERLICDLARAGHVSTTIARMVDVDRKTVRYVCQRHGVTLTKAKPMAYAKLTATPAMKASAAGREYRSRAASLRWGAPLGSNRW